MRRLRHLMRKELLELRQDPKLFGILFVAPLIQLTFLGYAATTDVKNVPVVVADADRSAASRELVERFEGSPYFTIVGVVTSVNEVDSWLERGTAWVALGIPAGYHERIGAADAGGRAGDCRRHRRELDQRGTRVRAEPGGWLLRRSWQRASPVWPLCRRQPSRPACACGSTRSSRAASS